MDEVRGRDGMSTPQNGVAAYSQSHVSRICRGGFPFAFPADPSLCSVKLGIIYDAKFVAEVKLKPVKYLLRRKLYNGNN